MNIAFIAPFGLQPKTTVSARMLPLAHALAQRGHMVRVVIPPWDDPNASSYGESNIASLRRAEDGRLSGVHIVVLPLPGRLPKSIALTGGLVRAALRPTGHADTSFESREYAEAVRKLTTFRADVAHVFKPIGYSGLAGLVLQALRVPWVLDTDDWEGPGGWADVNPYSLPEKAAVTLLEAMLPRMAGAVTAASHTLQGRAWGFGLPRSRVFYMPNGIWHEKYAAWIEPVGEATKQKFKRIHGLQDSPVILLYTRFAEFPWRWPLDLLRDVLREQPRAKLLVVGGGFFGEENK
ncbi:MAG: glycosyltransferase, partial [Chloroflexi bacterium]|nr:glycosyltransferase [Chloroflexota bacterium]